MKMPFSCLKCGDYFKYNYSLYLKIRPIAGEGNPWNAVSVKNGIVRKIYDPIPVEKVEIEIKEVETF